MNRAIESDLDRGALDRIAAMLAGDAFEPEELVDEIRYEVGNTNRPDPQGSEYPERFRRMTGRELPMDYYRAEAV